MALIKIEMPMPPVDGMDIKFKAPCDCTQITGLLVEYPEGSKEFTFRDFHGNNLAGIGNLFGVGAYIKVIVDVNKCYAYLQNADNNGFLNSAVFGTYTHEGENLIGYGENGKFKATTSGTISTINVNGVAHSIRCGEESSIDLVAGNWYTFILDGDTVNFNSGGAGGGGLNFKVVGSLQPPVSPKENMIWVNCEGMTGWYMQPTQPENMQPGEVWISTGIDSQVAFNAAKKGVIMVYPLSAKQMVGGALVDVTAKSYQNGEWADWITSVYLFSETNGQLVEMSTHVDSGAAVTIGSDGISFTGTSGKACLTTNKNTFEKVGTFYIEATISYVGTDADWAGSLVVKNDEQITTDDGGSIPKNPSLAVARAKLSANNTRTKYGLSIPEGSYYIGVAGNIIGTIHNMWYEK